jgi:antitoxin component of MazEF toxin-antitoxin module
MTIPRAIVKTIRVQPGLNVLVEDSHNILIEITTPDGTETLARSGAVTNIRDAIEALDFARTWVAITEGDSR